MDTRLSLKSQMKIGPQMVMAGALLRVSSSELDQMIAQELTENPALERANELHTPGADGESFPLVYGDLAGAANSIQRASIQNFVSSSGHAPDDPLENMAAQPSVIERLSAQMTLLIDDTEREPALWLLHALDEHGYLRMSAEELADEFGVSIPLMARLISILRELEPPGIGARDVCDCFLLQCADLNSQGVNCGLAPRILAEAWEDFVHQRWDRVARKLRLSRHQIEDAWHFIYHNLYPYPLSLGSLANSSMGNDSPSGKSVHLRPDLIVYEAINDGRSIFTLEIPGAEAYELRISIGLEECLGGDKDGSHGLSAAERAWIQEHVGRARLFMAALHQRWITLRRIGEYLIRCQKEFFAYGLPHLKPLTRAEIAADLGCHESTVSRAIGDKTLQLPNGRQMALSDFFDNSLVAKAVIRQILATSDQPLSDGELAEHLCAQGLNLARRTVAKYRQQLQIPNSHRRRPTFPSRPTIPAGNASSGDRSALHPTIYEQAVCR